MKYAILIAAIALYVYAALAILAEHSCQEYGNRLGIELHAIDIFGGICRGVQ